MISKKHKFLITFITIVTIGMEKEATCKNNKYPIIRKLIIKTPFVIKTGIQELFV